MKKGIGIVMAALVLTIVLCSLGCGPLPFDLPGLGDLIPTPVPNVGELPAGQADDVSPPDQPEEPVVIGEDEEVSIDIENPELGNNQKFSFLAKEPGGGVDIKDMYASMGINSLEGRSYFSLSGEDFVPEELNAYAVSFSEMSPDDPLADQGIGYADISISVSGSFVPADGSVTKAMEKLTNVPRFISGGEHVNTFELPELIPGCESGEPYNHDTGELCLYAEFKPNFSYDFWVNAEYHSQPAPPTDDDLQIEYSFVNGQFNVNGGIPISAHLSVGQTDNADGPDEPWPVSEWDVYFHTRVLVTGDYQAPVYDGTGGKG